MAQHLSSAIFIAFLIVLDLFHSSSSSPVQEPKKEEEIQDSIIHRPLEPSDTPIDISANERGGPTVQNEKTSSTEMKDSIERAAAELGGPHQGALNEQSSPVELTGQSGPLQVNNPRGSPLQPIELPQPRRPNVFDSNDYGILNRLRLPFRSFDEIPLRSFYDAGIDNTPFGSYNGNNYNSGPFRSDRGGAPYRPYPGQPIQGVPFGSGQGNQGQSRQFYPQPGAAVQQTPFASYPGSVVRDRSFAPQPGQILVPQQTQNTIPRPFSPQYNIVRDKPVLSQPTSFTPEKPFTAHHDNIAFPKPFPSQHGTVALDNAYTPQKDTADLPRPHQDGVFAVDKEPTMLQQETVVVDKPPESHKEVSAEGSANFGIPADKKAEHDSPIPAKCSPNRAWKLLINPDTGVENTRE